MTNLSHGNQQPSPSRKFGKVQRLSRKGVGPSGPKRGASQVDDEIVCAAPKDAEGQGVASQVATIQYMNISTYALQTAIDPALEALGVQMAYRMAQIINLILQNTADGAALVDASCLIEKPAADPMTSDDVIIASQSLTGVNALPFEDGRFTGVIHAHIVGDILLDKTNNSLTDVLKRTTQGNERLMNLPSADGQTVPLIDWGGVSFFQSTLVKQTPNYDGTAFTALRTYIVGRDGLIGVSFGAKENTQIGNGDWRNLAIWVRRLSEPSGYDPSRI